MKVNTYLTSKELEVHYNAYGQAFCDARQPDAMATVARLNRYRQVDI